MANIPIKTTITQTATNAVKSSEFNLDFTKGNAFRIDRIQLQITDYDAIADADDWVFQIATEDNNGGTLLTIDDEHEILTLAKQYSVHTGASN